MPNSKDTYSRPSDTPSFAVREDTIEYGFIGKLQSLKYEYRDDIRDRASLEKNFREKFEALNRVKLAADTVERDDFWATTSNKQLNFGSGRRCAPLRSLRSHKPSPQLRCVQRVKTLLKQNGRAALVLPDNVLFFENAVSARLM